MKIVLLATVEKLGLQGDVRDVQEGYARNFLFPKKLAVTATPEALQEAERLKKEREHAAELDLTRAESLAERLEGFELILQEKANENGKLFAAVTKTKIVAALKKRGIVITEKYVLLPHPLKEVGEYDVQCELPHRLEATIRVMINAGV